MLRSIPSYSSQPDLLTDEMLAARSFTSPAAVGPKTLTDRQ